jgi:ABC-type transport system substrate-binding protein
MSPENAMAYAVAADDAVAGSRAADRMAWMRGLRMDQPQDINQALAPDLIAPTNHALCPPVYDTPLAVDMHLKRRPRLATSWEWSPDFLRFTFRLRPASGSTLDGRFTSADARFNLEPDAPRKSRFNAPIATFIGDYQTLDGTLAGKAFSSCLERNVLIVVYAPGI